jgi:hypothetical protein
VVSYAKSRFSADELRALEIATRLVSKIPDVATFTPRCHEIARAVAVTLKKYEIEVDVVDGTYGSMEHTWLVTDRENILDTYAPGREPQVQLVDMSVPHFAPGFARPENSAFGRPRLSWSYQPLPRMSRYAVDTGHLNWIFEKMND